MELLSRLLPSVRDTRLPLVVGYVWVLIIWVELGLSELAAEPDQGSDFWTIFEATERFALVGVGVLVSFVAFLIGSVSVYFWRLVIDRPTDARVLHDNAALLYSQAELRMQTCAPIMFFMFLGLGAGDDGSLIVFFLALLFGLHGRMLWGEAAKIPPKRDLSEADLGGAHLKGVNFAGRDLTGADFSAANLSGANLRGAVVKDVNFNGADLSNIDLAVVDGLRPFQISGASNLSGANLRGLDLGGVDLRWKNLSGADLSGANLAGSDMRGARLNSQALQQAVNWMTLLSRGSVILAIFRAPWVSARGFILLASILLIMAKSAGLLSLVGTQAMKSQKLQKIRRQVSDSLSKLWLLVVKSPFVSHETTRLHGACLEGARIQDAWMIGVAGCRADFSKSNLRRSKLQSACLSNSDLSHSKLTDAMLQGANLSNSILVDADVPSARLQRANLRGADFRVAILANADFTKARVDGIKLGGAELSGAKGLDLAEPGVSVAGLATHSESHSNG